MKVPSPAVLAVSLTLSLLPSESSSLSSRALSPGELNDSNFGVSSCRIQRVLSLSPSSSSSSRSATQTTPDSPEHYRRIRKSPGAPLVDSSLLRYISKQKQTQFVTNESSNDLSINAYNNDNDQKGDACVQGLTSTFAVSSNDTTTTMSKTTTIPSMNASLSTNTDVIKQQMPTKQNFIGETVALRTPALTISTTLSTPTATISSQGLVGLNEDASQIRMCQYNHHTIAQRLVALGAEEEEAKLAGQTVQRYCLVRTARRKIRLFLKQRDDLWRSGTLLQASPAIMTTPSTFFIPTFGLDDTLEVMQEKGLTGKDICAVLTHTPSLALMMPRKSFLQDREATSQTGKTLEETLERSFNGLLLQILGLRKCDARKVLRTCPGLLTVRGSRSAEQIMTMMTKLGVSEFSIACDKASLPSLLSRSPSGMFRLLSFLCSSAIRMPIHQVGPLFRRRITRELIDQVVPIPGSVISVICKKQDVVNDNGLIDDDDVDPVGEEAFWTKGQEEQKKRIDAIYRNMTRTAFILRDEIGTEDLGKVISAFPSVLLLDVDQQILPVARYLMDDLGILKGDLGRVLQLFPILLGMDISEMKKVVDYIVSLGVEDDDLSSIFRAFPVLLTMKTQDMQRVVDYLSSIGVTDMGAFVTRLPPILGYSVEKDLIPKWEFLKTVCMFATFEIQKFPAYFTYPFERVIQTRYDYLSHKRISRQLIPVDAVLRFGDKDFAIKVARDEDDGKEFQAFRKKRDMNKGEVNPNKRNVKSKTKSRSRSTRSSA